MEAPGRRYFYLRRYRSGIGVVYFEAQVPLTLTRMGESGDSCVEHSSSPTFQFHGGGNCFSGSFTDVGPSRSRACESWAGLYLKIHDSTLVHKFSDSKGLQDVQRPLLSQSRYSHGF